MSRQYAIIRGFNRVVSLTNKDDPGGWWSFRFLQAERRQDPPTITGGLKMQLDANTEMKRPEMKRKQCLIC